MYCRRIISSITAYYTYAKTHYIDSANTAVQTDVKVIPLLEINECESTPCQTGATCHDHMNGYVCSCSAGYTGPNCERGKMSPSSSCIGPRVCGLVVERFQWISAIHSGMMAFIHVVKVFQCCVFRVSVKSKGNQNTTCKT